MNRIVTNPLQQQFREYVHALRYRHHCVNDQQNAFYAIKMITQAYLWVSPLNIVGTAQEFACDPRYDARGLQKCIQHFIGCGAAQRFAEEWEQKYIAS